MKKLVYLLFALMLIFVACESEKNDDSDKQLIIEGDTHPYMGTKEIVIRPTDTKPQIDGKRDRLYKKVGSKWGLEEFNLEYMDSRPTNQEAVVYVTYDVDFIYVYVEIKDKSIDCSNSDVLSKDNVSVMLNYNYIRDKVDYTNYFANQTGYIIVASDNTCEYRHAYNDEVYRTKIETACHKINNGYSVEMKLPILEGFEGSNIGFEVMNTDCEDGEIMGVRTWNIDGSQMTQYAHCAGTLKFENNLWGYKR